MNKKQEIKITVRFPSEIIEILRPIAREDNRSLNGEIIQAVQEFIERRRKRTRNET